MMMRGLTSPARYVCFASILSYTSSLAASVVRKNSARLWSVGIPRLLSKIASAAAQRTRPARQAAHGLKISSITRPLAKTSKLECSILKACSKRPRRARSSGGGRRDVVPRAAYFCAM